MSLWRQIVVEVPADEAETVSDLLWSGGVAGIEERPAVGGRVLLVAGMDAAVVDDVSRALSALGYELSVLEVAADAGLDGWRDFARPVRVGGIEVWPEWLTPDAADSDADSDADPDSDSGTAVIRLDAGRSFGHGAHVTTRLALELVQRVPLPGLTVLDVGTGSGVLALAAAALGASTVVAVDIAPQAIAAAEHNVSLNGFEDVVDVRLGTVPDALAGADLVVANVEAPILVELGAALARALAPGGHLVVSGFLEDREADVLAALGVTDPAEVTERVGEDGWVALVVRLTPTG